MRKISAALACGAWLASSACRPEEATPGGGVVLTANGIPVSRDDVDRLGLFVKSFFHNLSFDYARSVALVNTLIPRAVALSHFQAKVEPLRKRIEEIQRRIEAGEDFDRVGREASDFPVAQEDPKLEWVAMTKFDYLLGEWLFSMKPGEVSQPVLTRHGWFLIQCLEQSFPPSRMRASARLHAIVLSFDRENAALERTIQEWVNEADIRVVDPAYESIVPEWVKYRPGARQWKPIEPPAEGDGGEKKE